MAFKKKMGDETFEIDPITPYTEDEVKQLIDNGETVNEHYPRRVIKKKGTDEPIARFTIM